MAKFNVEHKSSKAQKAAYEIIKEFMSKDNDFQRIDPKIKCEFDDIKMTCKLVGSQFKAEVSVAHVSNGSHINVLVDLPLLLTPFKGKVIESLQKKFNKYLG